MALTDSNTLGDAKEWLRERVQERGAKCPCCKQMAKIYRRKLNAGMAQTLIRMYKHVRFDESQCNMNAFMHVPSLPGDNHEASQLVWWGLIAEERREREDGGRAGWWRITYSGRLFVNGHVRVRKYAHVYDGVCLKLDGPEVNIRDCLGSKFNYDELMRGV